MTVQYRQRDKRSADKMARELAAAVTDKIHHKHYDHKFEATIVSVPAGRHYVTDDKQEILSTILGSCIAACVRNPRSGFGGMNHFMLPVAGDTGFDKGSVDSIMRYGNHAMEVLINEILARGCLRQDMEIKIFGGANIINGAGLIGTKNVDFIEWYLDNEKLKAKAMDIGGARPRRVYFSPTTGKVKIRILKRRDDSMIFDQEARHAPDVEVQTNIELFDR